ncbi:unnamed protein product [Tuber melanosporum]|uniref:tRNA(His) guanylyltransferase n=1 Tax=Tuber melanosporum (strain Mel28) TaxID=656061 RepID=D5G6Q8_TUBMM|nr:uncharacterized protein GSTUM_00002202001 [Tuber melanosporum]CAZ80201.1 unnamed protein product [Tuber melanosporum]
MANSKYDYVRGFEAPHHLLRDTYIILRLDGRCFTKFAASHHFQKPNDPRALHLMNASASATMRFIPEIALAFGQSDGFSFLLPRECALFDRREEKLLSIVVFLWPQYFAGETGGEEQRPFMAPPSFDCRATCYPHVENVKHYFSWRQVDTYNNNLYNTTFWALVLKGGLKRHEAAEELQGTSSADKNEILFSRFGINYNNEPAIYRKGSVQQKQQEEEHETAGIPKFKSKTPRKKEEKRTRKTKIVIDHVDIIGEGFWERRPWLLGSGN